MPKITFILNDGSEKTVDAPNGISLLEVAHKNGVALEGACEGSLACSTCHVYVTKGKELLSEAEEDEEDILDKAFDVRAQSRAAAATG